MILCNFSAGITSTIATKLAIDKYGKENCRVVFFETGQHHPDNERYIKDCENLFGLKIEIFKNKKYKDAAHLCEKDRYINGPSGARCTLKLKKEIRQKLEQYIEYDAQVFGFEYNKKEMNRALRFQQQYPDAKPIFPLIDQRLTKQDCFKKLSDYGIEMPAMYKLGYHNNNCIGCVKGGMGYWNKIRKDFPAAFKNMAEIERVVGNSCIKGVFLDELGSRRGRHEDLTFECGAFCQVEMFGIKEKDNLEELRTDILNMAHN